MQQASQTSSSRGLRLGWEVLVPEDTGIALVATRLCLKPPLGAGDKPAKETSAAFALEAAKIAALHDGQSSPLPSLAELLGLADQSGPARWRLLEIAHPAGRRFVRVAEPVIQLWLPARAIQPLPTLLAACRIEAIRALAWLDEADGGRPLILLDAWRLPIAPGVQGALPAAPSAQPVNRP